MASMEPHCPRTEPLREGDGPFRPNVAGLILRRHEGRIQILLGERHDTPGAWQWPQGGLDEGEAPEDGLYRELKEEIGVTKPRIIYRFPHALRYRFPQNMTKRFKRWIGQEQIYFILTLDSDDSPDLAKAEEEEFRALRWHPLEGALESAVWFKAPVYKAAIEHAREILPGLPGFGKVEGH